MKSKIWRNFTFLCEAYSRHMAFLKNSKCSVIKVSGMRLRSSIDQARKLVAHEFPLYPWAQRKERSQMRGYHLRLPFIYFFFFFLPLFIWAKAWSRWKVLKSKGKRPLRLWHIASCCCFQLLFLPSWHYILNNSDFHPVNRGEFCLLC